jgi:hypothetical protein
MIFGRLRSSKSSSRLPSDFGAAAVQTPVNSFRIRCLLFATQQLGIRYPPHIKCAGLSYVRTRSCREFDTKEALEPTCSSVWPTPDTPSIVDRGQACRFAPPVKLGLADCENRCCPRDCVSSVRVILGHLGHCPGCKPPLKANKHMFRFIPRLRVKGHYEIGARGRKLRCDAICEMSYVSILVRSSRFLCLFEMPYCAAQLFHTEIASRQV